MQLKSLSDGDLGANDEISRRSLKDLLDQSAVFFVPPTEGAG